MVGRPLVTRLVRKVLWDRCGEVGVLVGYWGVRVLEKCCPISESRCVRGDGVREIPLVFCMFESESSYLLFWRVVE